MNYIKIVAVFLLSFLPSEVLASSTKVEFEEASHWVVDPITLLAVVAVIFIIVIKAHFKHSN